jgi:hypothetical protein
MTGSEVDAILSRYDENKLSNTPEILVLDEHGKLLRVLTEQGLKLITQETVDFLIAEVRRHQDVGMSNALLKQLIELKKAYYPATQKSVQANVDAFDTQLAKWFEAKKELTELEQIDKNGGV